MVFKDFMKHKIEIACGAVFAIKQPNGWMGEGIIAVAPVD